MELTEKRIAFIGDSITQGIGVSDQERRYDRVILREAGLAEALNYGISGTRFAYQTTPSTPASFDLYFCGRACLIDPRADVIVVYGGVNDYLHGDAPIGIADDRTPSTFWGAVWCLMNTLKTQYVDRQIVFMTPAHAFGYGQADTLPSSNPCKRSDALPLADYVEIIKARGAEFGIPVLDLYHTLGIDSTLPEDRAAYIPDGVHFNEAGHAVLARHLIAFLKSI